MNTGSPGTTLHKLGFFSRPTSDPRVGHRAARHPSKVLNHLDHAIDHVAIARQLNLHPCVAPELFVANGRILHQHQRGDLDAERTIMRLAVNGRLYDSPLSEDQVRQLLRNYYAVVQCEFHPSDRCNQSCKGCTYGHDHADFKPPPVQFPFTSLDRLAAMKPRAITYVGGGEPALYKDAATGHRFAALVARIRQLLPHTRTALITNGTVYPSGDWANEMDWIRLSVDAATAKTYEAFRGKPYFDRVCDNLLRLLTQTNVPRIGVGFVFCAANIHEAAQAARFFYDLVRDNCPDQLPRFNVQYRPLRRDPKDFARPFPAGVSTAQIAEAERHFETLATVDPAFARFLSEQTNAEAIARGNTHREASFGRCGYSDIFRIVRANGDVRPCCMRLAEPEFHLGNILTDTPEKIALNTLYNAAYLRPGCDGPGCKLGGVNRLLERGIAGEEAPSIAPDVAGDPFFG